MLDTIKVHVDESYWQPGCDNAPVKPDGSLAIVGHHWHPNDDAAILEPDTWPFLRA